MVETRTEPMGAWTDEVYVFIQDDADGCVMLKSEELPSLIAQLQAILKRKAP